ncbi:GATA-type domain-containing protein [Trichoderma simmonsii]|uniref:GATA-type domain-containing protein n=1 Tax=Trichoderma simmonsii TaxID=1491479 RepID=A0A8G0L9I4_9HYPO|nr:GATA-type domain-containing protein [Trichoderma simmonsii]
MEPKIAPLVNRCLGLFETFSNSLSSSQVECSTAHSHLARFRLWAGSLGAHRESGGRSLEYRLRDSSFVRNHIISLLQELVSSIDEAIQLATTDSDDKEALDDADLDLEMYFQSDDADEQSEVTNILGDIGHIIDCLLRLSITIRNPARHDQFNSKVGVGIVSSYTQWDINHIREKFSRLDDKLVDRLGMAMSRRRQYIKYREEHSKKLAHGLLDEPGEGENATTIASSIPKKLKDEDNTAIFTKMDALLDNMSEVSGTSYANSVATTNELRVPSIPREYIDGPFLCPICHTLIIINDRNSWKKHVFRDLQPYVCLFDDCSSPSQVYQRRKDWAAHMKQEHWVSWSCSFGCSKSFRSQESFEKHITTIHGQNFESVDLQAVLNLCRFSSDTNTVGICPFCFDYEIKSDKSYQSHIGDHLERLALFVLPKTLYDDDSDDDNDDDDDDDGDDDGNNDDDDSDIEMRLMKDDEYSNDLEESRGGDSWENEELDVEKIRARMDHQMQLELLEQQNKKRLMMALQEQSEMEGISQDGQPGAPTGFIRQPSPDTSPQAMKSGASLNPEEQMNSPSIHDILEDEEPDEDNTERMHPLMDYNMQLELLEQANKKRLMMARRQEQSEMEGIPQDSQSGPAGSNNGQPFPDTSHQETRSESPPTFEGINRVMSMNNSGIHDSRRDEELNKGNTESTHPLMDYMPQLELLEQQNKKRLMRARQEQSEMERILRDGQPSTPAGPNGQSYSDISPMAANSGASPNLKDQIRHIISRMDSLGFPSPNPDDGQSLESPEENVGQAQVDSMDPPSKKVSFAKGKNIAVLPSTALKYQGDSPDSHPDSQDSAMRRLKRYGSLSTFHGEGPIETSPTSAPRAGSTDTIVPRPRDYSETQRLKDQEDLAEAAETAELAAEYRRKVEEESRQLEELVRESDIVVEKRRNREIEYRRLKEEDSADAAEKMRQLKQEFRDEADLHDLRQQDLRQQLDTIKARDVRAELSRRLEELERRAFKKDEEAAEEMRQLEKDFRDEAELRYARQELDAIKEREANAEMERRILKERELLRLEEEDAAEAAEEQRRVREPLRQLEELKRESDIVVEQRIKKEIEYSLLKEEDPADAAERIRIVSGMLRDDAELRSLQRKLDATQKGEASAIEKRIMKEPELRRLIEEEYAAEAAEAAEGKRPLEGDFREDGESSKEEDQDVPMDGDSIKPPYGITEVEKRRGRAAPPGRCHSCNRLDTPLWRRGPDGERTLCNACGLRYANLERIRQLEALSLSSKPEERDAVDAAELISLRRQLDAMQERLKLAEEFAELKRLDDEEYRDDM